MPRSAAATDGEVLRAHEGVHHAPAAARTTPPSGRTPVSRATREPPTREPAATGAVGTAMPRPYRRARRRTRRADRPAGAHRGVHDPMAPLGKLKFSGS